MMVKREREAEVAKVKADKARKDREDIESSEESADEEEAAPTKTKHDLMLRADNKHRGSFFKQAKKSYAIFPVHEERIKWDDYGEIIRPEDYIIVEASQHEEEKMDTSENNVDQVRSELPDMPTKCITSQEKLDIQANVLYIDFEGRSDGESIRKILAQIKPRQLILVRGNQTATEGLADYCRNTRDLVQGRVFVPKANEVVDATTESHIYQVKLLDSVVSALQFYKAKDYEVAWIDSHIDLTKSKIDTSAVSELAALHDATKADADALEIVPTLLPHQTQVEGHKAVFINEPKLSDFKQILVREGIQAEFSGGALICNNVVAVRRNETGRLMLEGCLCADYYKVRSLLYDQFAIV